jgi:plastocyanin
MRRSLLLLTATLALGVTVAGCGSDSSGSSSTSAAPAASTSTPAAANAGTGTVAVEMKNIQFVPKNLSVTVGQTVRWIDLDSVQHNVVADSGADFKSDVFGRDGTFEWTATKPGKVEYECTLHPGMVGTITVR